MYIPLNTSTITTALATAIANSLTHVPSESVLPLGTGVGSGPSGPEAIDNLAMPSSTWSVPSDHAPDRPRLDGPFPDFRDKDYYRLGEDPIMSCIRAAVNNAGHERYMELKSNNELDDFLIHNRDKGLVGIDTNRDGNNVQGLVEWVRTIAEYDNPDLDPETRDPKKCARLVKRFTSHGLLEEIIVTWASRTGLIGDLPPTRPPGPPGPPVKRQLVYDVNLDNGNRSELKVIDGVISYVLKDFDTSDRRDHAKSKAPYNNSTLRANSTGLASRLCAGTVSPGVGPVLLNFTIPSNFTFPWNLTVAGNSTDRVQTAFCELLASNGNVTVHHSLNSTGRVLWIDDPKPGLYNSSTTAHKPNDEPTPTGRVLWIDDPKPGLYNSSTTARKFIDDPTPTRPSPKKPSSTA